VLVRPSASVCGAASQGYGSRVDRNAHPATRRRSAHASCLASCRAFWPRAFFARRRLRPRLFLANSLCTRLYQDVVAAQAEQVLSARRAAHMSRAAMRTLGCFHSGHTLAYLEARG
jgi:hypothetical protein